MGVVLVCTSNHCCISSQIGFIQQWFLVQTRTTPSSGQDTLYQISICIVVDTANNNLIVAGLSIACGLANHCGISVLGQV